ncbi:glyoxylase-like metal-dependent hydrolase (beta-lactamase superfamily II) [Duganella sp. 1224]|uniref:MBL fold metallo-hydrolase n=1 Tax=Duganella sp. 1224 TaxID=2587052 RepID=UPI0015CBFC22|nr:MBL fold metallo-hydrolase [Duganella sp. 1224]NYE62929.1 glyoxylase-like metal-dependent hydrolase (beta-lactamase superfamily II) [Duganella sp. 1224]
MRHCLTRAVLAAALIAGPANAAPATTAAGGGGWQPQQTPGFYRLRLGDFRVTVLSDGVASRDVSSIMSNPATVRRAFADAHQALPVELSINCYLIDTGSQRVLVDTGAGELFGDTAGSLVANLRAAGYAPEDIDVVLLTHIHGDHSGGLSVGGKRVFPRALVYVDRRDPAYWLDVQHETQAPSTRRLSFQQSRQTVNPYVAAGMLRTFDGDTEIIPGIHSVTEYGHTPGMNGYMVESKGQRLYLWGDIIHAAEVQFRHPEVTIDYDVDAAAASATRATRLSDAAKQGYLVGGAHLSFPGLGHVQALDQGYQWMPLPYSAKP